MTCRLVGAEPLSEPILECCSLVQLGTNFSEILIFIQENTFESVVCEMAVILSRT